jgi:hypothetical protein
MRRPAELRDVDRRWHFKYSEVTVDEIRALPEYTPPTRRFARVRAASTATKFALLVAGVVLASLAIIAAEWAVSEVWV